jgi:hypothetical protein
MYVLVWGRRDADLDYATDARVIDATGGDV